MYSICIGTKKGLSLFLFLIFLFLIYIGTNSKVATLLMYCGIIFFIISYYVLRRIFNRQYVIDYSIPQMNINKWHIPFAILAISSLILLYILTCKAGTGLDNYRLIWAFNEDEGHLAEVYTNYLAAKHFNLGADWYYTYGSINAMLTIIPLRIIQFVIPVDGITALYFNRILLIASLVGTGWVLFCASSIWFNSPWVGVFAALLLWTNPKVLEVTSLANYPDIIGMLLFTAALLVSWRALLTMKSQWLFMAPLLFGLAFGVKYMGTIMLVLYFILFFIRLKSTPSSVSTRQVLTTTFLYGLYIAFAQIAAFILVNPYYIINYKIWLSHLSSLQGMYSTGNINNLPSSGIEIPDLRVWISRLVNGSITEIFILLSVGATAIITILTKIKCKNHCYSSSFVWYGAANFFVWLLMITSVSKFAFFHYFLPVLPILYFSACLTPRIIIEQYSLPLKFYRVACIFLVSTFILVDASLLLLDKKPDIQVSKLGYATSELHQRSRIAEWHNMSTYYEHAGKALIEVGNWLTDNCPDTRSLIATDTIFYYPPLISQVHYMNRQLTLPVFYRFTPDLLIISKYFMDMYTKDFLKEEIDAMPVETRNSFIASQSFYKRLQAGQINGYNLKHTFIAPPGLYWQELYVYENQFKRRPLVDTVGNITASSNAAIFPEPNNVECFTVATPNFEQYFATIATGTSQWVKFDFEKPIKNEKMLIRWYSAKEHPTGISVEMLDEDSTVKFMDLAVDIDVEAGTATSEFSLPEDMQVSAIIFRCNNFTNQQRFLISGWWIL